MPSRHTTLAPVIHSVTVFVSKEQSTIKKIVSLVRHKIRKAVGITRMRGTQNWIKRILQFVIQAPRKLLSKLFRIAGWKNKPAADAAASDTLIWLFLSVAVLALFSDEIGLFWESAKEQFSTALKEIASNIGDFIGYAFQWFSICMKSLMQSLFGGIESDSAIPKVELLQIGQSLGAVQSGTSVALGSESSLTTQQRYSRFSDLYTHLPGLATLAGMVGLGTTLTTTSGDPTFQASSEYSNATNSSQKQANSYSGTDSITSTAIGALNETLSDSKFSLFIRRLADSLQTIASFFGMTAWYN